MADEKPTCTHAFEYMADGSLYCSRCGSNVNLAGQPLPPQPRFCTVCSAPLTPDSPICGACGKLSEQMAHRRELIASGKAAVSGGTGPAGPAPPGQAIRPLANQQSIAVWRKVLLIVIIGAVLLTALVGLVLIASGKIENNSIKVVEIIWSIAIYGLFALASLTLLERDQFKPFAYLGLVVAGIALLGNLISTASSGGLGGGLLWAAAFSLVSLAFAQTSLLLLVKRRNDVVKVTLIATIVLIGVVTLLIIYPLAHGFSGLSIGYAKTLGVFALLDVAGTIVTPLVSLFSKPEGEGSEVGQGA